ncbi:MAG TPA: hypothetical protein VHE30_23105 [Polyangiaceae bacterium]|nr:hypothetical protein [Polyangiaceae bacterium]
MTLVLDAGAFIALERNDRAMWRRFKGALLAGEVPVSHGGVVGQVWRAGGPRQTVLARVLASVDVRSLDEAAGRAAGQLLARSGRKDVVDAAVVGLAGDGDRILTSDPGDLEPLLRGAGVEAVVVRV